MPVPGCDKDVFPMTNLGGSGCTSAKPCSECKGDCDSDADCKGYLKCFQRDGYKHVPGCAPYSKGAGSQDPGDKNNYGVCR